MATLWMPVELEVIRVDHAVSTTRHTLFRVS